MFKKQKNFVEKIALERIYRLFELAEGEFSKHPERSKRYVQLARKIGERNRVRFPQVLKSKFCKNCNSFLVEGKNSEIEIRGTLMEIKCNCCGFIRKTRASAEAQK